VEGDAIEPVLRDLQKLDRALGNMKGARRGVDALRYLAAADAEGDLPVSMALEVGTNIRNFFWNTADLQNFLDGLGERRYWDGSDLQVPRDEAEMLVFHFTEKAAAQRAYAHMRELGVSFSSAANIDEQSAPLFQLEDSKEVRSANSLEEIVGMFRDHSMKGLEVQRYKGLGEMNPDQLWESTMDPTTRFMKRIILDDAFEADRTFSMLMGDETAPRREYIADHAHEIENLDI
jgi:hypothetical protein